MMGVADWFFGRRPTPPPLTEGTRARLRAERDLEFTLKRSVEVQAVSSSLRASMSENHLTDRIAALIETGWRKDDE
jgi:hypothetical protein